MGSEKPLPRGAGGRTLGIVLVRLPALVAVLLVLVLPASASAGPCAGAGADAATAKGRHAVRCLVNAARVERGLPALRLAGSLTVAATRHARAMARRDFFAHVSPGGSTPAQRAARAGWRGGAIGETLAWGAGWEGTARGVVRRWLTSARHREVLLDGALRVVGIGSARGVPVRGAGGPRPRATVVADLGRP